MSVRSRRSSKNHGKTSVAKARRGSRGSAAGSLDRPFDKALLQRAEQIARQYRIVLECDEQGDWIGSGVELPTVFGGGQTPDECVKDTRQALIVAVAHLLELGQHPPEATARTLQVNIRLTPEEKLVLTSTAHRIGFQGLSDYVRAVALERAERTP